MSILKKNKVKYLYCFMMTFIFYSNFSRASDLSSQKIPQEINLYLGEKPIMVGDAVLSKLIFDIYHVSFYTKKMPWSYSSAFALHVNYMMDISVDQLVSSTLEAIQYQRKVSSEEISNYEKILRKIYIEVHKNDYISAIFNPPHKLILFQNGKLIGENENESFVKDFFNIWIGENSQFPDIRNQLTGQLATQK